jgi:sugar fermentation stimulation protein A
MEFPTPLIPAILEKRYKRFLADVRVLEGEMAGETITVHCPNPGSMMGLKDEGNPVWISDSQNPKRKLRYTLELMEVTLEGHKTLVGINTNWPNKLGFDAISKGLIKELSGYDHMKREVKYGENCRIDILLFDDPLRETKKPNCYVEIKNVHLMRERGLHEFPDSVTSRGAKHLNELGNMVELGHRAVMLFIIQREDGDKFKLARDIDSKYGAAYDEAIKRGVESYAIRCKITLNGIEALDMIEIKE